jgi:ABC-type transport system involved in Fe-S cluster assembly fused permease/ATPase subunit
MSDMCRGLRRRKTPATCLRLLANPRILILDKAPDNLDSESTRLIQESLQNASPADNEKMADLQTSVPMARILSPVPEIIS